MEIKYNIKLFTIISYVIIFCAFIIPKVVVTNSYRYGELHNLWAFSVLAVFAFHGIAVFLSILNIAFSLTKIKENRKKYYILLFCNIPVLLFWIWIFVMIKLKSLNIN